ncbi:hypothetical protein [Streptomyces sp. NPDC005017]
MLVPLAAGAVFALRPGRRRASAHTRRGGNANGVKSAVRAASSG